MKRLSLIAAIGAVTFFIPMAMSAPVAAAQVCEIGFTGPNSNNLCVSEATYSCEMVSNNNVTVQYANEQVATSGTVTVDGNGMGGGAVSGSSSNNNTVNFNVSVDNTGADDICLARVVVPPTDQPETPTPEASVTPSQKVTPSALPVTSGSVAPALFFTTGSTVVVAALVFAYRRLHL